MNDELAINPKQIGTLKEVLSVRPFLYLWGSQFLSQVAFNMLNFLLVLRVYELTRSNIAVSLLVLAFQVPGFLVSLPAGAIVDRFNKKKVMIVVNLFRAAILLPLIFFPRDLSLIYIFALFASTATQFFIPAEAPMIPTTVPKGLLLPANALFTVTMYASIVLGFLLAGGTVRFLHIHGVYLLGCILFLLAAILNYLIPLHQPEKNSFTESFKRVTAIGSFVALDSLVSDIIRVFETIRKNHRIQQALILMILSQSLITMLGAVLPGFATTVLGIRAEDSAFYILAPASLGMIVGSVLIAQTARIFSMRQYLAPGIIFSGVIFVLFPLIGSGDKYLQLPISSLWGIVLLSILLGVFNAMMVVPANTILQDETAENQRGRMYAIFSAFTAFVALIPILTAGFISDTLGVSTVLVLTGSALVLFGMVRYSKRDQLS